MEGLEDRAATHHHGIGVAHRPSHAGGVGGDHHVVVVEGVHERVEEGVVAGVLLAERTAEQYPGHAASAP